MEISPSRDEIIYKHLKKLQDNFAAFERLDNLSLHKKIWAYRVSKCAELHDECIGIFKAIELHLQAVRGSSQEESHPISNAGIDAAYCTSETERILHSLPEVVGHLFNTTIHLNNVGNTVDSTFRSQSNVDVGDTYTSRALISYQSIDSIMLHYVELEL
ncbi:hypothetical protein CVT24_013131 [Panaeolus cyanescens]|uniref:Uncharacterized protein n=1 Tax=Panaeolus cyanescens TaxID=181874 RepID=A0A409X2B3_9AGAR|nr:hypothetical protein CVT24_013131 [Panaeolus cyanescens]